MVKKQRNSNIELLRIIAMLFIVASHFYVHGAADVVSMDFSFNKLVMQFGHIGNLGVDIFIIITGYFLSTSTFKIKRVISLEVQVLFYSIFSFIIIALIDRDEFTIRNIVNSAFPAIRNEYWFYTSYLILFFLSPFINIILNGIDKKQNQYLLAFLITVFSIFPTFLNFDSFVNGGYIFDLIVCYCLGAYIKRYPDNWFKQHRYIKLVIGVFALISSTVVLDILGQSDKPAHFYTRSSTFVILVAVELFSIFVNFKEKNFNFVNIVGGSTFGVYLIHEYPLVRTIIWRQWFNNSEIVDKWYLIFYYAFSVIVVFVVCSVIEIFRQKLIEPYTNKLTDKLLCFIQEGLKKCKLKKRS